MTASRSDDPAGVPHPRPRRAVALVDGEHYPQVTRDALAELAEAGTRTVAALFLGGTEKVARHGARVDVGVPATWAPPAAPGGVVEAAAGVLEGLLDEHRPDVVVDLSDEPVLDQRERLRLAGRVLLAGVAYEGADFRLWPPPRPRVAARPTIAVIGTGKRTGKTAVAAELARALARAGVTPVIVAMGRGGPPRPVVVPAGARLEAQDLLAVADAGGHAASDFYEDAITTGAATVGARRCGGGLAGAVVYSNVDHAVRLADGLPGDVTLLEGSGAAVPPVHADATALVVPGDCDPSVLCDQLGPYRVLLADEVVVTMGELPRSSPQQVASVVGAIRSIARNTPVVRTTFRPHPLGPVAGARVFLATTAPAAASGSLAAFLEQRHGCRVVAWSNDLADRPALSRALEAAGAFDVLLVELKAAAVDVAVRTAASMGVPVVFCDNRPVTTAGEDDERGTDVEGDPGMGAVADRLYRRAHERFPGPGPAGPDRRG
ncbi:MAG: 2,3-diphosphoglycerate synthetase [Actinomycetota bacterium]|nr:2,3-diphosphoglycerate synthetase [Actinomycetota bacterium]